MKGNRFSALSRRKSKSVKEPDHDPLTLEVIEEETDRDTATDLAGKNESLNKPLEGSLIPKENDSGPMRPLCLFPKYLKELLQIPLLTLEEELGLGREIKEGRETVMRRILEFEPCNGKLERLKANIRSSMACSTNRQSKIDRIMSVTPKIIAKYAEDNPGCNGVRKLKSEIDIMLSDISNARKKLVEANLRLVVSIARKYYKCGLEFDDLIQEGNKGLMAATSRYDYATGYRFCTYASYWIHQSIQRAIATDINVIHSSSRVHEDVRKFKRIESELITRLERRPEIEEIAQEGGWTVKKAKVLFEIRHQSVTSISGYLNDEGEEVPLVLTDHSSASPLDTLSTGLVSDLFEVILDKLPEQEKAVIIGRFRDEKTLEDISREFGVTREWIRQLESKALKKIRFRILHQYPELSEYVV